MNLELRIIIQVRITTYDDFRLDCFAVVRCHFAGIMTGCDRVPPAARRIKESRSFPRPPRHHNAARVTRVVTECHPYTRSKFPITRRRDLTLLH